MKAFVHGLETRLDRAAALNPNPGWRPFQRLTRSEYTKSVKDLLDLDVDVTVYLPPDTNSHGFDNVADAQSFSPTLFEGYLRAASQISRLAVGDRGASATSATYRIPQFESQMRHVEGHAIRRARRHGGHAHVPRGRHLRLPRDDGAHGVGRAVRQHLDRAGGTQGAGGDPGERRARGGARIESRHERRRRQGDERRERADSAQGRSAADRGGLPAPLRRPGGRPDVADRQHADRHAHRHRLRRHRPAAHPGRHHHRAAAGDRRVRYAEPSAHLLVPPDLGERRREVRAHDHAPADRGRLPRHRHAGGPSGSDALLRRRPRRRRIRERHPHGGAVDPGQPALRVPRRARAGGATGQCDLPHRRHRAGLAPVVLPVGHGA